MIALYLDLCPDEDELVEIQCALGEAVEPVRIPCLLPVRPAIGAARTPIEPSLVRPHLRRAGIERFRMKRVALVAPRNRHWYASFAEAIHMETSFYPFLVQTAWHRAEIGYPGPLRVVDLEAYIHDEDSRTLPPWLEDGGLIPDLDK